MSSKKELEARLNLTQRQAALMLVENEMGDGERRTQEQIAEELGITRMCLYKWRTQNKAFIDYKNMISDEFFAEKRDFVYRQMFKLIGGAQPSVRAIDLYLRRHGLLTEKHVVEEVGGDNARTADALSAELAEIKAMIKK
ncbi:hypothetical protein ER45_030530 (plasmid) [Bacillus mycoides]|nr:hypothetical protein ER45_030530 [Bacillus mycoides]